MNTQIAFSLFCVPFSRQPRAHWVLRLLPVPLSCHRIDADAPCVRGRSLLLGQPSETGTTERIGSGGVPGTSGWAHINDNRTAQITAALSEPSIWVLKVGEGDGSVTQSGTVEHSAGQLTVTGNSQIGVGEDTTGTYDISGASILDVYSIDLGRGVQGGTGLAAANGVFKRQRLRHRLHELDLHGPLRQRHRHGHPNGRLRHDL